MNTPTYDIDFFSDAVIADPHPYYAAMRSLGPVVYLPQHDNFALTRHAEVQQALRNPRVFSSASGVAGDKFGSDFLQGNTVASDPPRHTSLRKAMAAPLLPGALASIQSEVDQTADTLIHTLLEMGEFDAVADLARHLPLTIVRDMVGLPDFGQANMLRWASAAFNVLGMQNERGRAALEAIKEMREFIAGKLGRDTLRPGSWTWRVLDLVDRGELDPELAPFAIRDYINPSLDTTISATGQLIWQLARNPDEWDKLRDNPGLCRNAVNEAVRLGSPIRSFSRHTTTDIEVSGVTIPKGSRVMMLFASANRDESVFPDPDRFDITRNPKDHVGFGSGPHMCVGMHLAQMEMIALLEAMIPHVARIEVGKPEVVMNNTISAFASLPCQFIADTQPRKTSPAHAKGTPEEKTALRARIAKRREVARDIVALEFEPVEGIVFPKATPGAHIDLHVRESLIRQYSLTGDIASGRYEIAVQREADGRGGSRIVFDELTEGTKVTLSAPRNHFPLHDREAETFLFSGGIGLTPILAMAWALHHAGRPFRWAISARSREHLAFAGELELLPFRNRITFHFGDEPANKSDPKSLVSDATPHSMLYVCGPGGYMDAVFNAARAAGWSNDRLHREYFRAEINSDDGESYEIEARRTGKTTTVAPNETILTALQRLGISVETSCQNGVCGTCLTRVLEGRPDHRDLVLTPSEKASGDWIAVCCSRSESRRLVLDV